MQVSDGVTSSQSGFLRIAAYPLQIKLKHNTGLVVVHRSFTYLRPSNLSFATNSDDSSVEIRYDIVTLPQYGVIQKSKDSSGSWTSVDYFTSKDVESDSVRYMHNVGSPSEDEFKFQASVREVKTQQNFDFKITFIDLELREVARNSLDFTNAIEIAFTPDNLKFQTNPLATYPSKIKYTIVEGTKYGETILDNDVLRVGGTFSQNDIDSGRLKYRLFKRAYSAVDDEVAFQVSAPQCQSIASSLSIKHRTGHRESSATSSELIESLRVVEGSKVPLRIVRMNPKSFGAIRMVYNLTVAPAHGWLAVHCRVNESSRSNATYFVTDEINDENVYYYHDDSETRNDSFKFVAVSTDNTDFMYAGEFNVEVALQNDNPPERSIETIFHVVSNGERPITSKDLAYEDRDTGTQPADLLYTRKIITNGGIYDIEDSSLELEEFTQRDIDDRKIMFRHRGDDRGRFEFDVSDGRWSTKGTLDIRASPPYIRFRESNASIVRFNASVALSLKEIDVDTNFNTNDRDMKFGVIGKPKHGALLKHGRETSSFSREDLIRGNVVYLHLGGSLAKDDFKVRAAMRGVSSETRVTVRVYPKSYWEALIVRNNRSILVEETTSVSLNKKSLEIVHPNISSSEITYLIRDWPKYGYLEVQSNEENHSDETTREDDESTSLVRHFDQSMVNEARVYYVQSSSNQTRDSFVVDVTNGVTWARGLTVNFIIIPDKVYLETTNLTVVEGKTVALAASNFRVITTYFAGKITDYKIITKPNHGSIIDSTKNNQIKKFSQKHLNAGVIIYKHNGDESLTDYFRLTVTAGDKTSQPIDLWINVQPVNDEVPVLVNRSVITVWQGGSVLVDTAKLASLDNDTTANEIIYNLTSVRNGYLWHTDAPDVYIYNFTQAQIDRSNIVFTHTSKLLFHIPVSLIFFTIDENFPTKSEIEVSPRTSLRA